MTRIRAALFDLHNWYGDKEFTVSSGDITFEVHVLDMRHKPRNYDLYIFCDELIWSNMPYFVPKSRRIGLMKESPIHFRGIAPSMQRPSFETIFTHDREFIECGAPYERLDYSSNWIYRDPAWPWRPEKEQLVSFVGNVTRQSTPGYQFRKNVSDLLRHLPGIQCFGIGVNPVDYKTEALAPFSYSVVMENEQKDYYYSEKLIDCFITRTIPIYWGCPSIGEVFDQRAILTFSNEEELKEALSLASVEDYASRLPFVEANLKSCQQQKLDSFDSYLLRLFERLAQQNAGAGPRFSLGENKLAAGIRYVARK